MTEPVDYAPSPDTSTYSISPLPTFIAYAIVYIVVGGVMFFAAPNIEAYFSQFQTELPLVTRMTLSFSRWFRGVGWLLLLPVPIVLPFALTRISRWRGEPQRARHWCIVGLTSIVLLVIGVIMILSVWLPLMNVMWGVSSPKN